MHAQTFRSPLHNRAFVSLQGSNSFVHLFENENGVTPWRHVKSMTTWLAPLDRPIRCFPFGNRGTCTETKSLSFRVAFAPGRSCVISVLDVFLAQRTFVVTRDNFSREYTCVMFSEFHHTSGSRLFALWAKQSWSFRSTLSNAKRILKQKRKKSRLCAALVPSSRAKTKSGRFGVGAGAVTQKEGAW